MYNLPETGIKDIKNKGLKLFKNKTLLAGVVLVLAGCAIGAGAVTFLHDFKLPALNLTLPLQSSQTSEPYTSNVSYEQAIIDAAKNVSPSVVSIVISKNLPVYEQQWVNPFGDLGPGFNFQIPQYVQKGSQLQEIGAGSGFIISADGLVLTNKHVVSDNTAEYTIFTNDGQKYTAKVLALDPVQDLAVIKIQQKNIPN